MKTAHVALVSLSLVFLAACKQPPKPRQVAPITGSPTGEIRRTEDTNGRPQEDTGRVVLGPEGTQVPDANTPPVVTPTEGGDAEPQVTPTAATTGTTLPAASPTSGPTPATQPSATATAASAPTLDVFVDFAGGYFRNCISYRLAGQTSWTLLGCTKTSPASSASCVGTDTAFQVKTSALAVNASAAKQVVDIKVDTFKNATVCNAQSGTFTYPVPAPALGAQHWAMATSETNRKQRFRCTKTTTGAQHKIVLRYEDAASPDASDPNAFRDLHIILTARGTDVGLEGLDVCTDPP